MYDTTRLQAKGQVTLPQNLREDLELEPGDELVWVKTDAGHWEVWTPESLGEVIGVPAAETTTTQ